MGKCYLQSTLGKNHLTYASCWWNMKDWNLDARAGNSCAPEWLQVLRLYFIWHQNCRSNLPAVLAAWPEWTDVHFPTGTGTAPVLFANRKRRDRVNKDIERWFYIFWFDWLLDHVGSVLVWHCLGFHGTKCRSSWGEARLWMWRCVCTSGGIYFGSWCLAGWFQHVSFLI